MSKQPHTVSSLPMKRLKVISAELPPYDVAGHDEWLLDEALAETFPASDPIAVSRYPPDSDKRA